MDQIEPRDLGKVLERGARPAPQKTAVVCGNQRKTYQEMYEAAEKLAAGLSGLGYKKGDRVAVYMKSSVEFVTAFYALQKLGIIVAWVNPLYRKNEAGFILENSGARAVFIFREWNGYDYLDAVLSMKDELPGLEHIIVQGGGQGPGVIGFQNLMDDCPEKNLSYPDIQPETDLAMLIYTSGTTGNPKGAMITHYQAIRAGWEYTKGVGSTENDIFIGVLPMSHSYGCGATLIQPLLIGATLVLMDQFNAEEAFKLIEKEKVTLQFASPVHYLLELNHAARKNYDLRSLRAGLIAGQPAPEGLITRVEKEMGVYLTSFWGASEVGPGLGTLCPYPSSLDIREKYIGIPVEGTSVKVVDPVSGEETPDRTIGELTLSGWHVLKGYWNNPAETARQIQNGWLFTGDLVSRDENGYFRIYGRNKDLINRGGYKIYPYELESLIIEHPKVAQVCVVATPNPVLGENICACIIPCEGSQPTLEEIRQTLEDKIAPHKLPNELCIMEDFPKLSGGVKVKKFGPGGVADLAIRDKSRVVFHK
jgi:fatty-acyl-CoA synthase